MKNKYYTEEQIIWYLALGLQATVDTVDDMMIGNNQSIT